MAVHHAGVEAQADGIALEDRGGRSEEQDEARRPSHQQDEKEPRRGAIGDEAGAHVEQRNPQRGCHEEDHLPVRGRRLFRSGRRKRASEEHQARGIGQDGYPRDPDDESSDHLACAFLERDDDSIPLLSRAAAGL